MRHGSNLSKAQDPEEGLSPHGEAQTCIAGRALAAMSMEVDRVVASPKKRSQQTAALVGTAVGYDHKAIIVSEAVKPLADPQTTLDLIIAQRTPKVLVVGHLPSLGRLASLLLGASGELDFDFQPTSCCLIEVINPARPRGTMRWFLGPAEFAAISP